jgi:plasmid stabilization system protein ParE
MTTVKICSAAEDEFSNALQWYAERNLEAAVRFDNDFDQVVSAISDSHHRFPYCDDRHQYVLMRRFPYQAIFRVSGEVVTIMAVAHTSREPEYWHGR